MGFFSGLFSKTKDNRLSDAIKEGAFLVDVRTPSEFSGGSVKGAVNIPLDKLKHQLQRFKGKENIIVFCRSGGRSSQAMAILEQNGYRNVLNGGSLMKVVEAIENCS